MSEKEIADIIEYPNEERHLEFKGPVSWNNEIRAKITKSIIALANLKDGGWIVIGKEEQTDKTFKLIGLTQQEYESFNSDHVHAFVYERTEPPVNFQIIKREYNNKKFMEMCNSVLEAELSAYRFVGNEITQITSKEEIAEIEEALETPLKPVRTHLEDALKLLSNRKSPDYRNSIKESISSVEAICRIITRDEKATLGKALDKIETQGKIELHGALKKAFDSLYGYTSSSDGIRHSLLEESNLSFEDAKFMLVSCSAFVNYLIAKMSKAGIKIS